MLFEVKAQPSCIAGVYKTHCTAKRSIFYAVVIRQVDVTACGTFLDMFLESRPTSESALPGDDQLGFTEFQGCVRDIRICLAIESRVEFPDTLYGCEIVCSVEFHEIARLVL
jgi:hypothetical protein